MSVGFDDQFNGLTMSTATLIFLRKLYRYEHVVKTLFDNILYYLYLLFSGECYKVAYEARIVQFDITITCRCVKKQTQMLNRTQKNWNCSGKTFKKQPTHVGFLTCITDGDLLFVLYFRSTMRSNITCNEVSFLFQREYISAVLLFRESKRVQM